MEVGSSRSCVEFQDVPDIQCYPLFEYCELAKFSSTAEEQRYSEVPINKINVTNDIDNYISFSYRCMHFVFASQNCGVSPPN